MIIRHIKRKKLIATSCALLLSGCASNLLVETYSNEPHSGVVHALPMKQFEVKITRRIAECVKKDRANNILPEMKVATTFEIKEITSEDPSAIYVIHPASLSNWANSAAVEISFHDNSRLLKSINTSVKDQAGPAIVTAIKIAGSALGVPSKPGGLPVHVCNSSNGIPQKVDNANTQISELKMLTVKLNSEIAKLTELVAEQKELIEGSDPLLDKAVADQVRLLKNTKVGIAAKQEVLKSALKDISDTSAPIIWPLNGDDLGRSEPYRISENVLAKWTGPSGRSQIQRRTMDVYFSIQNRGIIGRRGVSGEKTEASENGVAYRTPQPGSLMFESEKDAKSSSNSMVEWTKYDADISQYEIYLRKLEAYKISCPKENCVGKPVSVTKPIKPTVGKWSYLQDDNLFKEIKRHKSLIPQLGFVDKLVIRSRPLQSVDYLAEFSKDGHLTKAGYKETGTPLQAITTGVDTLATQIIALDAVKNGRTQAKLDEELKSLQTQVGIAEAQAKLNPPPPGESQAVIDMLNADVELLKAHTAELVSQVRIWELTQP